MKSVLNIVLNVLIIKSMKKSIQNIFPYKKVESDLNFDGINYPVNNDDIDKFEEQNPKVSINVFVIDEVTEQIVKHRALKNKDASCHIDLLRIDEGGASHYAYVKHMSRLINSQKSKFCSPSFFCKYCQRRVWNSRTPKETL